MNDIRHVFNSFFFWLQIKQHITTNPMPSIRPFKEIKRIKKPFTGEQMEQLRSSCSRERDLAMLEVLYSTAVRVGELRQLNRQDIDFSDVGVTVFGKEAKKGKHILTQSHFITLNNIWIPGMMIMKRCL